MRTLQGPLTTVSLSNSPCISYPCTLKWKIYCTSSRAWHLITSLEHVSKKSKVRERRAQVNNFQVVIGFFLLGSGTSKREIEATTVNFKQHAHHDRFPLLLH
ncbi:hypothetical protein K435DRAFT_785568 [Dendrothele bispora CBS 962.96]|uniref:Uncharacterized protein n=1 Tax=Dendrothele bispora (strain CBS 962.96) TaxID=1314807 RepID=A0A4S8KW27_DENBC|nr:hypothetical protein K435DRAFT_785568 [Dendrothele bispora CBS 962.96]